MNIRNNHIGGLLLICIIFLLCSTVYADFEDISDQSSLLERAKDLYQSGEHNQSLLATKTFLSQNPQNVSGLNLLGVLLLDEGNLPEANRSFHEALAINPDDFRILLNLGLVALYSGDLQNAEEYFNQSLDLNPDSPDVLFRQGVVRYGLQNNIGAIESFTKAKDLRPDDPAIWFNLAQAYEQNLDFNQSFFAYDQAITLDPSFSKPYYFKGLLHSYFSEYNSSVEALSMYTRLEEDDDRGWFLLSQVLKNQGKTNMSIQAIEKAIEISPGNEEYKRYYILYTGDYNTHMMNNPVTPLSFISIIIGVLIGVLLFSRIKQM